MFEEHICVPELPFFVCSLCLGMPRATWALNVVLLYMDVICMLTLGDFLELMKDVGGAGGGGGGGEGGGGVGGGRGGSGEPGGAAAAAAAGVTGVGKAGERRGGGTGPAYLPYRHH